MIDIIIINWNSRDYLDKCIRSILINNRENFVKNIYVVDNNSDDGSLEKIPSHEKIIFIRNNENLGFSKASNQGFKMSSAPYVLLLNPDTQLLDSTLNDCLNFMESNTDIDVLGCQLFNDQGKISPSCARFPTPKMLFFNSVGLPIIIPFLFKPAPLMTDWDHKTSKFVDQVMGAFMFMRRSVFDKVGYFDEQFFVYMEELDFSKRLKEAGGKSFYNSKIAAIHSGEGTTKNVKGFRLFLSLRSRLQYSKKHFSHRGFQLVKFGTLFLEPFARVVFLLIQGKLKETNQVMKGYKLLLKSLPITDSKTTSQFAVNAPSE